LFPFLDLGSPLANNALIVGEILFLGVFIYLILANLYDIIAIIKKVFPVLVFPRTSVPSTVNVQLEKSMDGTL
jgi:hypothetical protein